MSDALMNGLNCCICLDLFREPIWITPCGHSFCSACIQPCLAQVALCPICKSAVSPSAPLPRNYALETMVASARSFGPSHFAEAFARVFSGGRNPLPESLSETLEEAARTKVVQCMLSWKNFMKAVVDEYAAEKVRVEAENVALVEKKREEYTLSGAQSVATDRELQRLAAQRHGKVARLSDQMNRTLGELSQRFTEHISAALVAPHALPVAVHVELGNFPDRLDFTLLGSTNIRGVKSFVERYFESRGDRLHSEAWAGLCFVLRRLGGLHHSAVVLDDEAAPLLAAHRVLPGDVLAVVSEEDLPRRVPDGVEDSRATAAATAPAKSLRTASSELPLCFTAQFDANAHCQADFYVCETCKLQWICGACQQTCHSGHVLKLQIKGKHCLQGRCFCMKSRCKAVHKHEGGAALCMPLTCPLAKAPPPE
eukprot:RCo024481